MIRTLEEYITSDALENEYNDENPFDATKIPLDDKKVLSLFHDTSALGINLRILTAVIWDVLESRNSVRIS